MGVNYSVMGGTVMVAAGQIVPGSKASGSVKLAEALLLSLAAGVCYQQV